MSLLRQNANLLFSGGEASLAEHLDRQGGTAQIRVGKDVLGTVDQVDEDGERSWAVTLIVLEEDLA